MHSIVPDEVVHQVVVVWKKTEVQVKQLVAKYFAIVVVLIPNTLQKT